MLLSKLGHPLLNFLTEGSLALASFRSSPPRFRVERQACSRWDPPPLALISARFLLGISAGSIIFTQAFHFLFFLASSSPAPCWFMGVELILPPSSPSPHVISHLGFIIEFKLLVPASTARQRQGLPSVDCLMSWKPSSSSNSSSALSSSSSSSSPSSSSHRLRRFCVSFGRHLVSL